MNAQLATFFERLAASEPASRFLRRIGLDPAQFVLYLGLFRTLSERGEWMGAIGVNRFQISYLALFAAGFGAIMWTLMLGAPAGIYLMLDLLLIFALTFLTIIREAANALFNPVEISMLAHKPVHAPTYAAAKIAHVIIAVLYLVSGLSIYPAVIGIMLKEARWFWLLTHLSAAFMTGLWTAFMICALYGFTRRLVPANLLKSVTTWMQLIALAAFIVIPIFYAGFLFRILLAAFEPNQCTWLPPVWFAEIGLMGRIGAIWPLPWKGLLSIAASIVVIAAGLRGFSYTYFAEGASIVEGGAWRNGKRSALSRVPAFIIGALTGSPLGLGSFSFVSKMIRRDWQFRRGILTHAWLPFLFIVGAILIVLRTGELPSPIGHESVAHFLPHLMGLIALAVCFNLPFTDFHNVSWIYLTTPIGDLKPLARGVYWALWCPVVAVPHVILLPFLARMWGWPEALLGTGFNLIVVSLYLGAGISLISGLPFSSRADESKAMVKVIYLQVCYMAATAFPSGLQWFLFKNYRSAVVAGIALAIITLLVVRWALRDFEGEIRWRMHLLKAGHNHMFHSFED